MDIQEMDFNYITGQYALNIHPNNCKTTGDWHIGIWDEIKIFPSENVRIAGIGTDLNTNEIWGNYGIYEGKVYLKNIGIKTQLKNIYIANHIRAVLDMLYDYIVNVGIIFEIDDASNEYIVDKKSINEMLNKSRLIVKYLNDNQLKIFDEWYNSELKMAA